jgi:4-amino-4-deoxy-L-arabinose transferase-like glycosyltransferase
LAGLALEQRSPDPEPGAPRVPSLRALILGLFVLALLARLAWVMTLAGPLTWDDEREFADVARHLVAGDGFISSSYRANPVLPAYLALVFRVFGENYLAARVGQALFGALTCVLVALIAHRLFGATVAVVSATLVALYPPHVYLSGVFYVECLFTLTIAATVYLALRAADAAGATGWAFATGVSFAIATLTRAIFIAYLPFLLLALLWAHGGTRRGVAPCAALLLGVVLVISPWSLRNYAAYGRPILVSSGLGTKLWQGNNELTAGDADDRELYWYTAKWKERAESLDAGAQQDLAARYADIAARVQQAEDRTGDHYMATDQVLMPIALRYMAAHPGRTVELFVKKLVTLFSPFSKTLTTNAYTTSTYRLIAQISFLPLLVLAIVGVWFAGRRDRRITVLYALLASIVVAYGLLNTCTRFRLPLDPFFIILASLPLARMIELWIPQRVPEPGRIVGTRA